GSGPVGATTGSSSYTVDGTTATSGAAIGSNQEGVTSSAQASNSPATETGLLAITGATASNTGLSGQIGIAASGNADGSVNLLNFANNETSGSATKIGRASC